MDTIDDIELTPEELRRAKEEAFERRKEHDWAITGHKPGGPLGRLTLWKCNKCGKSTQSASDSVVSSWNDCVGKITVEDLEYLLKK